MPFSITASLLLVLATIVLHYEVLRFLSFLLAKMTIRVRARILIVVLVCICAHLLQIFIYAAAFIAIAALGLGKLDGNHDASFATYLYFSATSFSTLGIGDVFPTGALRWISAIEALNGLFLVAWSTSFTYLAMERLWPLHTRITPEETPKKPRGG